MIPPLHLPPGHTLMGTPTISLELDSAGAAWYGAQSKVRKAAYAFRIYRQGPTGAAQVYETGIKGQGRFALIDGQLVAVGTAEGGEGQQPVTYIVPDFTPRAPAILAPIIIPPDGALSKLYRGEYTAQDFDTPGEIALRVGKTVRALVEWLDAVLASGAARWG